MIPRVLVIAIALTAAAAGPAPPPVEGDAAPVARRATRAAFDLPDLDGRSVTLGRYRDTVLVLQWFNADCPFNARVLRDGTVQRTLDALKRLAPAGAFVAINSTAVKPATQLVAESRAMLEEFKIEFPVLIDADGAVGRRYDARTTPQVFVIERGIVRYAGAFTTSPWGDRGGTTNYAVNTLERIAAGEPVEPAEVRPWGCSVKYRK